MSAGTYPQIALMSYGPSSSGRYMKVMIGFSLALHVLALLFISGLRLPGKMERPLAAYEISLVTMPTPVSHEKPAVARPVEPPTPKVPEPPVPTVTKEAAPVPPPQPVRLAPTPHVRALEPIPTKPSPAPPAPKVRHDPPPPAPSPPPAVRQNEAKAPPAPVPPPVRPVLNRDVLRGIALPSEVPKLGQVEPIPAGTQKETRSQTQTDVQKILNNLSIPESAPSPSQQPPPQPTRTTPQRSVSDEVNRLLEQPPAKAESAKPTPPAESRVASKPATRTPVTTIQASGIEGGNVYLAKVQRLISAQWSAPQVGMTGEQFRVLVKFRLDKTGQVSGLVVERTSGNEYYDLAALRAVRTAILPTFPPEMSQPYFDAHFSFAVGEPVS
jgi:colicin import membrane protein